MRNSLRGELTLCGDKSLSHRALMFAALATGRSHIHNLSRGADVATTAFLINSLGNRVTIGDGLACIEGRGLQSFNTSANKLYCGNSGTTLRLMLGILAGSSLNCSLAGDESLNRRPVRRVSAPLTLMGAEIQTAGDFDRPPVLVRGQRLHGIDYTSPIASAQVKSAVLLAALNAEGATTYREPELSRDHTERWLEAAGVDIHRSGDRVALNPGRILSPFEYSVAGDISTAVFFVVAASVIAGSAITIKDVLLNPTRTGALTILRHMGATISTSQERIRHNEPVGAIQLQSAELTAFDTDGMASSSYIDEVPALAIAAMFAQGTTRFRNISELRVKESDRAQGIVDLALAFGCKAAITGDDLMIEGGTPQLIGAFDPRGDHRLAMALEIGSIACGNGLSGNYADAIAVSAPEFYPTLESLL